MAEIARSATITILLVDDDPSIQTLMRDFLQGDGFAIRVAPNAEIALHELTQERISCVLLDIGLPDQSGFDLCRRIREASDVPILFLTARDSDFDKIRGLGLGGDDYIVKSATPLEVIARIRAVLRRTLPKVRHTLLSYGTVTVDLLAREVRVKGKPANLAAREFDLLSHFIAHPRQVFTREQLFAQFWGEIGDRHTVTVHIARLREKLEIDPGNPTLIVTVWGVGYRFEGVQE